MKPINQMTWRQKLSSYKRRPWSLVLYLVVLLATVLTVGALLFLIGYILVMGIPNLSWDLFSWE